MTTSGNRSRIGHVMGFGEICGRCKHPWNSHAAPENPLGDPMPCEVGGCDCDNLDCLSGGDVPDHRSSDEAYYVHAFLRRSDYLECPCGVALGGQRKEQRVTTIDQAGYLNGECVMGLSDYALSMVGQELTYEREGKPTRSGVCKKIRRTGWMETEAGRFPAFELLIGGYWTSAFADYGHQPSPERTGLGRNIDNEKGTTDEGE